MKHLCKWVFVNVLSRIVTVRGFWPEIKKKKLLTQDFMAILVIYYSVQNARPMQISSTHWILLLSSLLLVSISSSPIYFWFLIHQINQWDNCCNVSPCIAYHWQRRPDVVAVSKKKFDNFNNPNTHN